MQVLINAKTFSYNTFISEVYNKQKSVYFFYIKLYVLFIFSRDYCVFIFSVPPGEPIIMDEHGQRLRGVIGPYDESSTLTLICEVDGGNIVAFYM